MRNAATFCLLFSFLFSSISVSQSSIEKLTTSINGTIINSELNPLAMVSSENGKYWCTYDVTGVSDEMRELSNLKLYQIDNLILNMNIVSGSDLSITNSGRLVFYDHSEHFNEILKINSFSKEGNFLFEKTFSDADLFEFSNSGEKVGVRTKDGISIISISNGNSYLVEKGLQIAFSEDDLYLTVAQSNKIMVYKNKFHLVMLFRQIRSRTRRQVFLH